MTDVPDETTAHAISFIASGTHAEMAVRLGQALELTDALWELVPTVVAAGEQQDRMSPDEVADASTAGQRLTASTRARLREAAREWADQAFAALDAAEFNDSALAALTRPQVIADPFGTMASLLDVSAIATNLMPALAAGLTSTDEALYYFSYLRAIRRSPRTPLLLRALFVTAIGTVEPLVTRMVLLLLRHTQPETYPSLTDPALDKKARELCYGPPRKWRDTLVDTFAIPKVADAIDWDHLQELWEDRNVIAHRGSVVDARRSRRSGDEIGTIVNPDPSEVRSVIDEVGAVRYALVVAIWDRIEPGTGSSVAEEGWPVWADSLRAGRWRQAEGLARVQEAFATDREASATAQVNRWLAVERGPDRDSIRDQILAWDVSGLPPTFLLARDILLHRDDDALRTLRELLADGTVTPPALEDWPLFDRLRAEGRLPEVTA